MGGKKWSNNWGKKRKPMPEKNEKRQPVMTDRFLRQISEYQGNYYNAKLNEKLYLVSEGFCEISNLGNFMNLKSLMLSKALKQFYYIKTPGRELVKDFFGFL